MELEKKVDIFSPFCAKEERETTKRHMFSSSARQPCKRLLFPRSDAVRSNSQKKKNFPSFKRTALVTTITASTSTSNSPVVVKSNKPSDAPKDPYKSLSNLQILSVTETDSSFVDVHSLFDPSCDKNVLILMRSFG
jgi:hypothetical protein